MRTRSLAGLAPLAVAVALVAAACGSSSSSTTTTTAGSGATTTRAPAANLALVQAGKLTVCSDVPYEPFEFDKDGQTTGFDIEILDAAAKANGLTVEVKDTPFDGILPALTANQCDVVGSAMTITEERAQQVDFSDPYFDADQSLLVRKENAEQYPDLPSLAGKTIGVQSGTTGEAYAKANTPPGATIKDFQGAADLFVAIKSGDVDAILQDFPVNAYRATQDDTLVVTAQFPTGEQYGFAVRKGNSPVLELVNGGLQALRTDGGYARLYEKYFGVAPSSTTTTAGGGATTTTAAATTTTGS